jgi:pimeloyl-ACP methyl ester carboxylesterase
MGGSAVISAAPGITPPVEAVVALSAPANFGNAFAVDNAAKLTQPFLVMCGEWDYDVEPSAESIYAAATKSKHRQLLITGSSLHGFRLVAPDGTPVPEAVKAMAKFLATYAPPK